MTIDWEEIEPPKVRGFTFHTYSSSDKLHKQLDRLVGVIDLSKIDKVYSNKQVDWEYTSEAWQYDGLSRIRIEGMRMLTSHTRPNLHFKSDEDISIVDALKVHNEGFYITDFDFCEPLSVAQILKLGTEFELSSFSASVVGFIEDFSKYEFVSKYPKYRDYHPTVDMLRFTLVDRLNEEDPYKLMVTYNDDILMNEDGGGMVAKAFDIRRHQFKYIKIGDFAEFQGEYGYDRIFRLLDTGLTLEKLKGKLYYNEDGKIVEHPDLEKL